MTDQPQSAAEPERCLCRQALEFWFDMFGVRSEDARQHLRNSRVEFLKAVRSILDERIDHLSRAGQPESGRTIPID
jgi:hypothetical protein